MGQVTETWPDQRECEPNVKMISFKKSNAKELSFPHCRVGQRLFPPVILSDFSEKQYFRGVFGIFLQTGKFDRTLVFFHWPSASLTLVLTTLIFDPIMGK